MVANRIPTSAERICALITAAVGGILRKGMARRALTVAAGGSKGPAYVPARTSFAKTKFCEGRVLGKSRAINMGCAERRNLACGPTWLLLKPASFVQLTSVRHTKTSAYSRAESKRSRSIAPRWTANTGRESSSKAGGADRAVQYQRLVHPFGPG